MSDFLDYGDEPSNKPTRKKRILLVDGTNVLFQTQYNGPVSKEQTDLDKAADKYGISDDPNMIVEISETDEEYLVHKRLTFVKFLNIVTKYLKELACDGVYICFDTGKSWRVGYTKGEMDGIIPKTKKIYKGKRRQDMTPKQEHEYKRMKKIGNELIQFFKEHSSVKCFTEPSLESDDMISHIPQIQPHHEFIVLSTDGDMTQIMKHANVQVFDLHHKKLREPCDVDWFLFEKCIRGDQSDNVQSALPRVRSTKIEAAYNDPYLYTNLMETEWKDHESTVYKVGDLFKENQLLMDLCKQPTHILELLKTVIQDEIDRSVKRNKMEVGQGMSKMQVEHLSQSLFKGTYFWLHSHMD